MDYFPYFLVNILFFFVMLLSIGDQHKGLVSVHGLGVNWGTRATHPLQPDVVVRLMKDNGFKKVKLFEAEPWVLQALGNSGIEVMLGIPNDFLGPLASSVRVAEEWVFQNVSAFISKYGVDIRYVAVGNEPFLKTYQDMFLQTTFPALKNVQAALIKAGLGRQVKVTVPLNADVYESSTDVPSGGNFRSDIHDLMISIIKFLSDSGSPITINIYPFLSLYADPHFPVDFAFFSGNAAPVVDGSISYTNVFDANFDTLVWALEKNGFSSLPIIIGEVGWPTDGDSNANKNYARRFNQGLFDRIIKGQGTPKRPSSPPEIYLFGLIDEDAKSIDPGNFERHWGLLNYDGSIKYQLNLGSNRALVPAKGVRYLSKQWCIMAPQASLSDPSLAESVNYACSNADCTSLGYGSSCGALDAKSNASYAFNMYYQTKNQQRDSCNFNGLATISSVDPSHDNNCRFEIMIDMGKHPQARNRTYTSSGVERNGSLAMALKFFIGLTIAYVLRILH